MIDWLAQSYDDTPGGLVDGVPPAGMLNPLEQGQLALLKRDKRRREWLLGRWTAKKLLQRMIWRSTGVPLPYSALIIHNDATRRPYATWESAPGWIAPLRLSISHVGVYAFCVTTGAGPWAVGADVEQVSPRPDGFAEEYFTPEEIAWVNKGPEELHDLLVSIVWSAKEAVLKALGLGLSVDTRSITCLPDAYRGLPDGWTPFDVRSTGRGGPPGAAARKPEWTGQPFYGWWRAAPGYVFTMAVRSLAY